MGTLFDYIDWRGDLSFTESPMNEVDGLIFSLISYLDFDGIVTDSHANEGVPLRAVANSFFAKYPDPKKIPLGLIVPKDIIKLFRYVKESRRFSAVGMRAYVNQIDTASQMQFSAISFLVEDGSIAVTYRGTDDTIVGWKENFNMSFMPVIPAQKAALSYLEAAATHFRGAIRVLGHSKGGNLSVYAATRASKAVKARFLTVYSFDGPGFGKGFLNDPEYLAVKPMIKAFVPESSVVGMLLEHDEGYTVIKSRQIGLWQHDGMSWEIHGPSFVYLQKVSDGSRRLDRNLNEWIQKMTPDQREQFVDALFQILTSKDAMTLSDLVAVKKEKGTKKGSHLDPHVYKTVQKTLAALVEVNTKAALGELFSGKKR